MESALDIILLVSIFSPKLDLGIIKMVQVAKIFVCKPDDLSSILEFHTVEEKK